MYLLDTNIISALRVRTEKVYPVWEWAEKQQESKMFISILTYYEIEKGIHAVYRQDQNFANKLRQWLDQVVMVKFQDNELELTREIMKVSAYWASHLTKDNVDILIAGTALTYNLTLVTRNIKDFQHIDGLKLMNPWEQ